MVESQYGSQSDDCSKQIEGYCETSLEHSVTRHAANVNKKLALFFGEC